MRGRILSKAINHLKFARVFKLKARDLFRAKIQCKLKEKWDFEQASQQLSDILSQLDVWKQGLTVASYRALPGELSPVVFQRKYQGEVRFVFPQIKGINQKIKFVSAVWDRDTDWEKSPWGGWQPSGEEETSLSEIDVFFVPALAFDREGRRLGRGKGFYDRILSQSIGLKIGLAGTFQISDSALPEEKYDIRMDAVLTDHFLYIPSNRFQKFNKKNLVEAQLQ